MNNIAGDDLLAAALYGYQAQLKAIDEKIAAIRVELGGTVPSASASNGTPSPKRGMSAAGRKRIAAAQRARWAAFHKESGTTSTKKTTPKKRVLSAAAIKRISEATKKRWAAHRAQRAGQAKAPTKGVAAKAAPKRKMSAARRAGLVANLAKARAAKAAKRAA